MKAGTTTISCTLVAVVIVSLSFAYPNLMFSPGRLKSGHASLASDCFACHQLFSGISSEKCISCHKVETIGLTTTEGKSVRENHPTAPFHGKLITRKCTTCHSDHEGMKVYRNDVGFSHELLEPAMRERCTDCHLGSHDRAKEGKP